MMAGHGRKSEAGRGIQASSLNRRDRSPISPEYFRAWFSYRIFDETGSELIAFEDRCKGDAFFGRQEKSAVKQSVDQKIHKVSLVRAPNRWSRCVVKVGL
jgi:hypothetical protein